MNINDKDKAFLLEHISNAAELIEADDINGILDALDGFMLDEGYAPPDYEELNDIGREAERVLDRIYYDG